MSPDDKQQTTSGQPGFADWPLLSKDQYRIYLSITNSKPRPNHSVGRNSHHRTRISTVPISQRPTTNHIPTTRLRTTVKSIQRSVTYLSLGTQQQTTSRSLCYKQRLLIVLYNDQYRTHLPTPNSNGRPDHSVGCNGHYRTRIKTAPISRRIPANHVPTTRFRIMAIALQRSVPHLSPNAQKRLSS